MSDKSCLIVDDSAVIREIASRIVTDLGFEATQAENVESALEHCKSHKTRVVLLDWDMPSMEALDFLKGAPDLDDEHRPTIILCATENNHQQFTLAKAAGADFHMLKPFDRASIEAVFAEASLIEQPSPSVVQTKQV